jgi:hypothetical protein
MATQYAFGKIVTDGLVLSLNAADRNSYPGSGTTWTDMSGNENNGTLTNGPTFSSANGGSIAFDGVDDYVNVQNIASNPTALTVTCFVLPLTMASPRVFFGYRSSLTELIQLTIQDDSTAYFQIRGSSNTLLNITQSIQISRAFMLTGIFNKITGIHTLYVNNVPTQGLLDLTGQTLNSSLTTIGATNTATYTAPYSGFIYNCQVYNRALSASEVLQNYNAQKSRFNL